MADKIGTAGNDILTGTQFNDHLQGKAGADILLGLGGDDYLEGGDHNDMLAGGNGNDLLDGGTGTDTMEGGAGDDKYYVNSVSDKVIEAANGGFDIVHVGLSSYVMGANIEEAIMDLAANSYLTGNALDNAMYLKGGNDTVFGGDGNDFIISEAGNDLLYGGAGNDVLNGGTGNNLLVGGSGDDDYVVVDWASAKTQTIQEFGRAGYDRVLTTGFGGAGATGALGEVHSFALSANLEEIAGTGGFAFDFKGNASDNTMTGGSHADTLDGGTGADKMVGLSGADTYVIDNAGDRALYETLDYTQMDTARITAAVEWKLDSGVERVEIMVGNATITGSAFDDYIYGSADADRVSGGGGADRITGNGGADWLEGGSGNDMLTSGVAQDGATLSGGEGDDSYYLGNRLDTVIELADGGTDIVHLTHDWVMGANIEVAYVEAATGNVGLAVTGNDIANQIYGGTGADNLKGGLGNDALDGGALGDTMEGGAGDDSFWVNWGSDVVTELADEGTDTVLSLINYTLTANVETLILGMGTTSGTGNALDNAIFGNLGSQTLRGMGGADAITGGAGADLMYGGSGADVFIFRSGDSANLAGQVDTIADFMHGKDKIDLTAIDTPADDPLHFIGKAAFTGTAGEVRYDTLTKGGAHIQIDTDGNGTADAFIDVSNTTWMTGTDFVF